MKSFIAIFLTIYFVCCKLHTKTKSVEKLNCPIVFDSLSNNYVYTFVDSMPKYKNGNHDVLKFILSNFNLKSSNDSETSFNLYFIVDTVGAVKYPRIKNKKAQDLNQNEIKLLDVMSKMPKWTSGKCYNLKVAVLVYLPIKI